MEAAVSGRLGRGLTLTIIRSLVALLTSFQNLRRRVSDGSLEGVDLARAASVHQAHLTLYDILEPLARLGLLRLPPENPFVLQFPLLLHLAMHQAFFGLNHFLI